MFDNFNKNAELNKEAVNDFRGVFNDINLGDSRLGSSTNERAKSLNRIVKLVDGIDYKGEHGQDILGAIYEYLIGHFAASAGKKGGEFYTPHEVSKILAKIVTDGVQDLDKTFAVYDPTCGSGSLLLTVQGELPGGDKPGFLPSLDTEEFTGLPNLLKQMNEDQMTRVEHLPKELVILGKYKNVGVSTVERLFRQLKEKQVEEVHT